eukprot:ANDGO_01093.mRNA.1 hypothetical protein
MLQFENSGGGGRSGTAEFGSESLEGLIETCKHLSFTAAERKFPYHGDEIGQLMERFWKMKAGCRSEEEMLAKETVFVEILRKMSSLILASFDRRTSKEIGRTIKKKKKNKNKTPSLENEALRYAYLASSLRDDLPQSSVRSRLEASRDRQLEGLAESSTVIRDFRKYVALLFTRRQYMYTHMGFTSDDLPNHDRPRSATASDRTGDALKGRRKCTSMICEDTAIFGNMFPVMQSEENTEEEKWRISFRRPTYFKMQHNKDSADALLPMNSGEPSALSFDEQSVCENWREISALLHDNAVWGSLPQLEFGYLVGRKVGIHPIYGAMLCPWGGSFILKRNSFTICTSKSGLQRLGKTFQLRHAISRDVNVYLNLCHGIGPGPKYLEKLAHKKMGGKSQLKFEKTGLRYWAGTSWSSRWRVILP